MVKGLDKGGGSQGLKKRGIQTEGRGKKGGAILGSSSLGTHKMSPLIRSTL